MTPLIRPSSRLFPPATPDLYDAHAPATTDHERLGLAVLAQSGGSLAPFAPITAYRGSPVHRLGRLLLFHRFAIDAEARQLPRRADFFWREAICQMEILWRDDAIWSDALADPSIQPFAAGSAMTPDRLRDAVLYEIFADSHWTFFQMYVRPDADPDNRGFVHLDYLLQLVTRTAALDVTRTAALARALRSLVDTCLRHRRWQLAEHVASTLIERFGDGEEHQNLLATAICRGATDEMKNGDDGAAAAHDAEVAKGIAARLETLRARFGRNVLLFDLLAGIHFRRAVALANSGQLADALVDMHKALAFDPTLEGGDEAREQLIQLMQQLGEQAQTLLARVEATPNARLTDKSRQMIREARRGFGPLNAFITSPEAARIAAERRVAHSHGIWRSLRLSPVEASTEQLAAFYAAVTSTLQRTDDDVARLESAWDAAIQEHPQAAAVDRSPVLAWVRGRIDDTAAEPAARCFVPYAVAGM